MCLHFLLINVFSAASSCAGPQIMSQPLLYKYVEHCLWAGTRPAPACGRLGWEEIKSIRNLKKYTKENSHGQSLAPNGALSLYLRDILASKLAVYPVG